MKFTHSIFLAVVIALLLCCMNVTGQEPVDSTNFSKYTEPDIVIISNPAELVIVSDPSQLAKVHPVDTMYIYANHSPAKAAIMSAVLPGLGQIYNQKYWKLPIVYLALGISVERFLSYQNQFNRYRRAYIDMKDGDPYTNFFDTFVFPPNYTEQNKSQHITKGKELYRTWRDWAVIAVVAAYALNIIDANVDAHMMDFNLDDNISLNIRPCFLENSINSKKIGLSLQFTF